MPRSTRRPRLVQPATSVTASASLKPSGTCYGLPCTVSPASQRRSLACTAFVAIFFFNVPYPIIIIAAGVIGYFGARSGRAEFAAIEHGGGNKKTAAIDSLFGEELPDHVRPTVARALKVSSVWLLLW